MSNRPQLILLLVAVLGGALLARSHPLRADDAAPAATAATLAAEGRFAEAYQHLIDGDKTQDPAALQRLSRSLLSRAIRSEDAFERWAGLHAGRTLADPALAAAAREQAHSAGRYEQSLALEILINADAQGSRDEFIAALDSPYRTIRLRGLRGLRRHAGDAALIPRLAIVATDDTDPDIRVLALRVLRDWQAGDAVPSLRRALDDPVPAVQQEAARTLAALGDAEVVEIVRRRVAESPPDRRVAALQLAAVVPRLELLGAVGPLLADPDPETRAVAAGAVLSIIEQAEKAAR